MSRARGTAALRVTAVLRPETDHIDGRVFVRPPDNIVCHLPDQSLVTHTERQLTGEISVADGITAAVLKQSEILGVRFFIFLAEIGISVRRDQHREGLMMPDAEGDPAFFGFLKHTVAFKALVNA